MDDLRSDEDRQALSDPRAHHDGLLDVHREANSQRLIDAFKSLDLIVSQDILPQESNDWADYVLPSTFFMENHEYLGVNYARDGWVQKSDSTLDPPEGCEARHDIWQFMELLRRINPEYAARVGYTKELKTRKEWQAFWDKQIVDKAWAGFIAKKNAAKPGEGDRIAREVEEKGYAQTAGRSTTRCLTSAPSRRHGQGRNRLLLRPHDAVGERHSADSGTLHDEGLHAIPSPSRTNSSSCPARTARRTRA